METYPNSLFFYFDRLLEVPHTDEKFLPAEKWVYAWWVLQTPIIPLPCFVIDYSYDKRLGHPHLTPR